MTQPKQNFRNTGTAVKLGLKILAASYKTLQTEKIKNSHSTAKTLRTAWPSMLTEFSDLVEGKANPDIHPQYSPEEIRRANEICDIYSKLPYSSLEKKLTLARARTNKSWRELSTIYGLPWEKCRNICDTVILHLVQVAAMDKYKHIERQAKQKSYSTA